MTLKAKLLTLVACLSLTSVLMAQTPAPVTLTIVHFNDVYEISPVEGGKSGGLARVATRIKQLAPQLVTLGGDYLSPSAHGRLVEEYYDLTTRGRIEIADLIERARELGDLKENGDYHAAKDQQGLMEARIAQLKAILDNAALVLRESEKSAIEAKLKAGEVPEHHQEFLERAYEEHKVVDGKEIQITAVKNPAELPHAANRIERIGRVADEIHREREQKLGCKLDRLGSRH